MTSKIRQLRNELDDILHKVHYTIDQEVSLYEFRDQIKEIVRLHDAIRYEIYASNLDEWVDL